MKIHKLTLEGFKNIDCVEMELGTITAIVGINNFGKTNLMKGIRFGADFLHSSIDERKQYMKDESLIPLNKKNAGRDYHFGIVAEFGGRTFSYSYSFAWGEHMGKIIDEQLRIRNEDSGRFIKYIYREDGRIYYRATEEGRCQKYMPVSSPYMLGIEELLSCDLFYTDILKKIVDLKIDYNRLSDSRIEHVPEYNLTDNMGWHFADGENVLSALDRMRHEYPEKYILWENAVKALVPGIDEFVFDLQDEQVPPSGVHMPYHNKTKKCRLSVKQRNLTKHVDLFRLSTGIRRIFLLILNLVLSDVNGYSIIEFEELESSINPLMLQRLLITISEICQNCRIIVSSHSPTLINFIGMEHIYIGETNHDDLARFYRVRTSKQEQLSQMADDMGVGVGDVIFGMLFNEDNMGISSLDEWVDKYAH